MGIWTQSGFADRTHIADRSGPDLVSTRHSWLTFGMASGMSTRIGPDLAMTTRSICGISEMGQWWFCLSGPKLSKPEMGRLWVNLCCPCVSQHSANEAYSHTVDYKLSIIYNLYCHKSQSESLSTHTSHTEKEASPFPCFIFSFLPPLNRKKAFYEGTNRNA